jgi:hypothetical protein
MIATRMTHAPHPMSVSCVPAMVRPGHRLLHRADADGLVEPYKIHTSQIPSCDQPLAARGPRFGFARSWAACVNRTGLRVTAVGEVIK